MLQMGPNVPAKQNKELMLTPSNAIGPQTLYPTAMDYGQFKALQALLFFSLPIIWCVWQLIALKRSSSDADVPER